MGEKPVPEMIERVARALCRLQCERNRRGEWIDEAAMQRAIDHAWTNWATEASAAIAAMHKPTDAMLAAGDDSLATVRTMPWDRMEDIWQAMIGAALP